MEYIDPVFLKRKAPADWKGGLLSSSLFLWAKNIFMI